MPARTTVFANGEIYHLFNRAVESRPIFLSKNGYLRAIETMDFYQYSNVPFRLSKFRTLNRSDRELWEKELKTTNKKLVNILAYCLMPNHIHFLLQQLEEDGLSRFMSNFSNSYTRYFNTLNEREGHLFSAMFKAVRIENDEQLLHVSRYIHLNPVVSYLIKKEKIAEFAWSSFPEYLGKTDKNLCHKEIILSQFPSSQKYKEFVLDQVDYGKKLEAIKHLLFK